MSFIIIYHRIFFSPFILQPTRLHAKTLIDNILMNTLQYQTTSGNILVEIADHLIQFLVLEGYVRENKLPKLNFFKRDLSKFSEREFNDEVVNGNDWEKICQFEKNDGSLSFKSFFDKVTFHLDEMAPITKVTRKESKLMQNPWITNVILEKCKKRDSILKDISKENDPVKIAGKTYKVLRNQITREKRESKKSY